MIQGGRDRSVRAPATLDGIEALVAAEWLDQPTADELADSYRLLRTIEHRVQMVEDAQTHLLPAQTEALDNVAQLHGLPDGAALMRSLAPHVERAGQIFDGLAPDDLSRVSSEPERLAVEFRAFAFDGPGVPAKRIAEGAPAHPGS